MEVGWSVYVDESGDEGFRFDKGSSDWFVLSSVIIPKAVDLEVVKLVDVIRQNVFKRKDQSPLHFSKLNHEQRLPFLDNLARARLHTLAVLMHKPSYLHQAQLRKRDAVYLTCLGLLFEALCWYSQEAHPDSPLGVEVTLSNRGRMSHEGIARFLEQLQLNPRLSIGQSVSIDNAVIQPKHINVESSKKMGLQLADAVASSFFFGLRPRYGFVEDRYVKMLQPCVYRSAQRGYALRLLPESITRLINTQSHLMWLREVYAL
jgi:hypothetical protein